MFNERMLEEFMDAGEISDSSIRDAVCAREVFPCYFGSALKLLGVDEFITGIKKYAKDREYPSTFSARVYKIG